MVPDEILYRCGDFDWVPLLGIWGAIKYTPLLVLRQYRSRQFIPVTQGLAECEFSYRGAMINLRYHGWQGKRINNNIPEPSHESSQSIEEHLRVIPSELEIIRKDFERRNTELEKRIEQMEEEKRNLRLDADVQKLEVGRLRKGKAKAEEDLDSLKTDYKKLRLSMRTVGLGKTLDQWREEIQEEKKKVDKWERRFQEVQTQNEALKKSLSENQKEKGELKNRERIEELKAALRNCEIRIEYFEANEDRQNEHLHYFQNQTLAVQVDTLSVKYELESSRGKELASLLKKIRVLSIRAKPYM
ncbi:hypothetical protein Goshw_004481 [Gossypium schwendimanii]|uniref:DUF7745 domain-containing protein n=1 Tax=Gossypium schwendimanii TaxID=34291 RepID=A0A7J9L7T1_GOSSC|nr:hypothetical protein [Gossypium schwendimanii]